MKIYRNQGALVIRDMVHTDIPPLVAGFAAQDWNKPEKQYVCYLQEVEQGKRKVFFATFDGQAAGYVCLLPQAKAGPFAGKNIPEIADFNVLRKFQCQGIGGALMDVAENAAAEGFYREPKEAERFSPGETKNDCVCLGVGLHWGYGAAQRMYIKRGYIPDGSGVWYQDRRLEQYESCANDDSLILYLSKKLTGSL